MEDIKDKGIYSWFSNVISLGKDLLSLLRDGMLFILVVLLIVFPENFNQILIDAGFEKGEFAGLTWKKNLANSDEALQKAEATIKNLKAGNVELNQIIIEIAKKANGQNIEKELDKVKNVEISLSAEVKKTELLVSKALDSNIPLIEKVAVYSQEAQDPKINYLVGLQTMGVPDSFRVSLNEDLKKAGYKLDDITYSYESGDRPSWFAYKSTVFYYSSNSRKAALELAGHMKKFTGQIFTVQRGAGLGVESGKREITFFIHYIK